MTFHTIIVTWKEELYVLGGHSKEGISKYFTPKGLFLKNSCYCNVAMWYFQRTPPWPYILYSVSSHFLFTFWENSHTFHTCVFIRRPCLVQWTLSVHCLYCLHRMNWKALKNVNWSAEKCKLTCENYSTFDNPCCDCWQISLLNCRLKYAWNYFPLLYLLRSGATHLNRVNWLLPPLYVGRLKTKRLCL